MSGGHFDYLQYRFSEIYNEIEELIKNNDNDSLNEWGDRIGNFYSDETIKQFKTAVFYLKLAQIYAQRVDYLESGDDGEEQFHKRLKEEIELLKNQELYNE